MSWSLSSYLDFAPEGVDAGVELVRNLLEGLVRFPWQDLETRVRDFRRDGLTEAGRQDGVELAGQD
jgi:hypothetical protein